MRLAPEGTLLEKLRKIVALHAGTEVEGVREVQEWLTSISSALERRTISKSSQRFLPGWGAGRDAAPVAGYIL